MYTNHILAVYWSCWVYAIERHLTKWKLMEVTRGYKILGIGTRLSVIIVSVISAAIQEYAESRLWYVQICWTRASQCIVRNQWCQTIRTSCLKEGMVLTIELMINTGTSNWYAFGTGWPTNSWRWTFLLQYNTNLLLLSDGPVILTSQGEETY